MNIGDKIRSVRKDKNIKMSDLASKLGISVQAVSQYELNKRDVNIDLLQKIADALEVSITDLIDPLTASKELLMESLHKDDDKKDIEIQKQAILDKEINKRLSVLNAKGKFEAFKRIDDLRFRIEYRKDLGFSTDLPDDAIFDNWMMKENEVKKILEQSTEAKIEDSETK